MGRRGSITEAQVFEAADALVAQGREVGPTVLLSVLGSGSFTTIYKHLIAWEESRKAPDGEKTASIPEAVLSTFGAAWRAACAEASKEVAHVREQTSEEVKAVQAKFQEALQRIERLEEDREEGGREREELLAKLAMAEAELHEAKTEGIAHKAAAEQLTKLVEKLEKDVERQRNEAKEEHDRDHDEKLELTSRIEWMSENLRMSKETNAKLQSDYKELGNKHEGFLKGMREAEEASKASQGERDVAMKEAAELRGRIASLQEQHERVLAMLGPASSQ